MAYPTVEEEAYNNAHAYSNNTDWGNVIMIIVIAIIVFMACRELLCWYFKINTQIKKQDEIIRLLKKIAREE